MKNKTLKIYIDTYGYYFIWWLAAMLTFLVFDILYCRETSFRPFTAYMSLYINLPVAATIFSLPAYYSRHGRWPLLLLMLTALLFAANLMYCRTYFVPIPLDSYGIADNLVDFTDSVVDSFRLRDITLFLPGIAAYIVAKKRVASAKPVFWLYPLLVILMFVIAWLPLAKRGGFKERMENLSMSVIEQQTIAPVYTIFASLVYDAMTSADPITDIQREEVNSWLRKHDLQTAAYAATLEVDTTACPRSILLILCESLESWPIGLEIEGRPVAPFLDSLVNDVATYYNPNVVTQVKDGRSIDAQLIMLAGQLPLLKGVYSKNYASNDYHAIPAEMKKRGATTFLISSDLPITWNQAPLAHAYGFDTFVSRETLNKNGALDDGNIPDGSLFRQSVEKMDMLVPPDSVNVFFGMIVTHTGHNPFAIPDSLDLLHLTGDYPQILKDYMTNVNYVDSSLAEFIKALRCRPDYNDMVIVITGDHEGLAAYRNDLSKEYPFVSSLRTTPLIILNSPYHMRDEKFIGQIDVYAAMLDVAGLYPTVAWRGMGLSPFDPAHPGGAVGSTGEMPGNLNAEVAESGNRAYIVADRILRYRLSVVNDRI